MPKPTKVRMASMLLTGASLFAMGTAFAASAPADFIIAGGTVYTGADQPPTVTDVVVVGDKIAYIGPNAAGRYDARTTINAKGKIVSPGFIDAHTHADDNLKSADSRIRLNEPWLYQGVATVMIGVDGDGTPDIADQAATYGKNGIGSNAVPYVGFGEIRKRILKDDDRAPTPAELEQMKALVVQGMCQGAVGFSTGLFYSPQFYAKTEEVIELAKEAAKRGGIYDTHQRDEASYSIGLMASVAEVIRIGREAQMPVHFSHLKALGIDVQGKAQEVIAAINAARAQGVEVTANQYPWTASGTSVSASLMPRWAEDGGRAALLKRLDDPAQLEKIRAEMRENMRRRGGAESLLLNSSDEEWTGMTLGQLAVKWKVEPVDAGIRIIKAGQEGGSVASFNMVEKDIIAFMRQPWIVTSSDGDGSHPRTVASFQRKYEKYVKMDKAISEAEFIRSSTGRTADIFKLENRGYLRVGYFADVTVFNPNTFKQKADYVNTRLLSEGVETVLINGKPAMMSGKATGELHGRVILRRPPAGTCS